MIEMKIKLMISMYVNSGQLIHETEGRGLLSELEMFAGLLNINICSGYFLLGDICLRLRFSCIGVCSYFVHV